MISWWHYLLLVNLYLVLFFGFYKVLLHRETFFQLNRAYLVAGSVLSFLIPLMQSEWIRQLFITQRVRQTIYATVNAQFIYQVKPVESNPLTLGHIIACIYITGAILLSGRLIYHLFLVKRLINQADTSTAFSFFKKIRIDNDLPDQQTILKHEQVHTRQWHTADVLLIEAVMIINWFNPVVYFYRKAIKHVHEYIADRKAIETGTSKAEYALLLLSQTFGTVPHQLTNNFFNHSLLKQRILMLNQNDSKRRALLKYGLSAPLFAAMLILSSATVNNSNIIRIINKKTEQAFSIHSIHFKTILKDSLSVTVDDTDSAVLNSAKAPVRAEQTDLPQNASTGTTATATIELHKDSVLGPDHSQVFNAVEMQPMFPGGEENFSRYLQESIHYPDQARENHITGRAFMQFVVEKDGSLSEIKCLNDPGAGLGQEAMRVLSSSPRWLPGIQNGKLVRVRFNVPVNFNLADNASLMKNTFDTVRVGATAKKTMLFLTYQKHPLTDSLGSASNVTMVNRRVAIIKLNGKTISPEDIKHINPQLIEYVNVIKADTAKGKGQNLKQGFIFIQTKDIKTQTKG